MHGVAAGGASAQGRAGETGEDGDASSGLITRPFVMIISAIIKAARRRLTAFMASNKDGVAFGQVAEKDGNRSAVGVRLSGPLAQAASKNGNAIRQGTTAVKEGRAAGQEGKPFSLAIMAIFKGSAARSITAKAAPSMTAEAHLTGRSARHRRGWPDASMRGCEVSRPILAERAMRL